MSHQLKIAAFMLLCFFGTEGTAQDSPGEPDSLLAEGRRLFTLSVKDKSQIKPAIDLFNRIIEVDGNLGHRALAYLGALYTIKAKHAFFPFAKLKWAKKGLSLLDEALSHAPNDIEVLFIHGTICHHLPRLFKRQDDAQRDFNKIINLLPANMHRYDEHFIANTLNYLSRKFPLSEEDQEVINKMNSNLSIAAGENE